MKFSAALLNLIFVLLTLNYFSAEAAGANELKKSPMRVGFEDLSRLVLEKNENVKSSQLHAKAIGERTGRLARSFFPMLSAQIGEEQFKTGSDPFKQQSNWKLEAAINLYRGGRDTLEDNIRDTELNIAKTNTAIEIQSELFKAKKTFLRIVALSNKADNLKEALEKNETNIRSAQKRAGAGITTTADAAQFELHRSALQRELIELDHERHTSLIQLEVFLGLDEHESVEIVGGFPALPKSDNEMEKTKLNSQGQLDLLSARGAQKISEFKATQANRWWLPKVDFYSSYGIPSLSEEYTRALNKDHEWSAGIRMSVDLGQGFEERKEASAQQLKAESERARLSQRTRDIVATDHELRHGLEVLIKLILLTEVDVEKTKKFLKLTENEYTRGVKNGPDLLEAFQRHYELRESRIQYLAEYFLAKTELERITSSIETQ